MKKIKIIKVKYLDFWYADKIGQEFEVKEFSSHPTVWWTKDYLPILKQDAEIV